MRFWLEACMLSSISRDWVFCRLYKKLLYWLRRDTRMIRLHQFLSPSNTCIMDSAVVISFAAAV
jgi:hypothetical protein